MPLKHLVPIALIMLAGCASAPTGGANGASAGPATASAPSPAGDGSSFATAIVIAAADEGAGVAAEYAWIKAHLPGGRPAGQGLLTHEGKPYDVIHVQLPDGSKRDVYFDISGFFGKM